MILERANRPRFLPIRLRSIALGVILVAFGVIVVGRLTGSSSLSGFRLGPPRSSITKQEISKALSNVASQPGLPRELEISIGDKVHQALVQYAFDAQLQETVEQILSNADPDYGALAAVDPETGRILALASHESVRRGGSKTSQTSLEENLALRATFPSASIFKVVTASAAIAEKKFSADTRVAFSGSNHTLYKKQVLKDQHNRWTRTMSLREAFAKSVNTVFGKIGVFSLGAENLRDYAGRFGFNRSIAADIPVQPGRAVIPADADAWTIAEAASGFTRDNTMSPLQGALIAASLINHGRMVTPYAVESVHLQDGQPIYQVEPEKAYEVVSPAVAAQMLELMRETVQSGTSRKSFRGFQRGRTAQIDAGGKTGSLTGNDPPGKYDWFVGYGALEGRKIALAALTINQKEWKIKSSALARRAIETYLLPVASH
jgi:cell division protein FtsI/penicillin-binding protein 2